MHMIRGTMLHEMYELFVYGRIKIYLRNEKIRPGINIIRIQTRVRFVIHGCTRTHLVSQCECIDTIVWNCGNGIGMSFRLFGDGNSKRIMTKFQPNALDERSSAHTNPCLCVCFHSVPPSGGSPRKCDNILSRHVNAFQILAIGSLDDELVIITFVHVICKLDA
jgi:hypothetical protein